MNHLARWLFIGLAPFMLGAPASHATTTPDDNGHHAFVRSALPVLLGRRAHGSVEVEVLVDLIRLRGREAVVRALMERPEYVAHWTHQLADVMRVSRSGSQDQPAACYDGPQRLVPGVNATIALDDGALAEHVGSNPVHATTAQPFNLYDLLQSSVDLDSLVPAYRAHLVALSFRLNGNSALRRELGATAMLGGLANRDPGCLGCHIEESTLAISPGWDRQHPLLAPLETQAGVGASIAGLVGLFRDDPFIVGDNELDEHGEGFGPWGLSTTCARLRDHYSVAPNDDLQVNFAGLSGSDVSIIDLADTLMWGYDDIDATELPIPVADGAPSPESAFTYLLAAQAVNRVYELVMGRPLTLSHGYARNEHQKALHKRLTENAFLAGGWSLRDLLTEIVLAPEFNRRPPLTTKRPSAHWVAPVFDAMLQDGPCEADREPGFGAADDFADTRDPTHGHQRSAAGMLATAPAAADRRNYSLQVTTGRTVPLEAHSVQLASSHRRDCYNTQGDIVHRHEPRVLTDMLAGALGWRRMPVHHGGNSTQDDYPSLALAEAIGQYLSQSKQGARQLDFSAYREWENAVAACDATDKLPGGASKDWIDRLLDVAEMHDAVHPDDPVRLRDLILALKDRLIQEPVFGGPRPPVDDVEAADDFQVTPPSDDPGIVLTWDEGDDGAHGPTVEHGNTDADEEVDDNAETLATFAFTGLPFNTPARNVSRDGLASRLRGLCGVYATSPQFMMFGLDRGGEFEAPRLQACLPGEPCGYTALCMAHRATLEDGASISCGPGGAATTGIGGYSGGPQQPEVCVTCGRDPSSVKVKSRPPAVAAVATPPRGAGR